METYFAILVGVLFAVGVYLMLRRDMFRLIMGLVLTSQAANLLIFTAGGLTREKPPLIGETDKIMSGVYADPLPQALILTAIVIGFAVLAFTLVLIYRVYRTIDISNVDHMKGENS